MTTSDSVTLGLLLHRLTTEAAEHEKARRHVLHAARKQESEALRRLMERADV